MEPRHAVEHARVALRDGACPRAVHDRQPAPVDKAQPAALTFALIVECKLHCVRRVSAVAVKVDAALHRPLCPAEGNLGHGRVPVERQQLRVLWVGVVEAEQSPKGRSTASAVPARVTQRNLDVGARRCIWGQESPRRIEKLDTPLALGCAEEIAAGGTCLDHLSRG